MKLKLALLSALVLSGCQMTSGERATTAPENTAPKTETVVQAPNTKKTEKQKPVELSPQEQSDVWQRIAMQMKMPVPDNKRVNYYRNWYLKHPGHLETVSERAQPFLFLIAEEVEKRNMPLELALLPVVESSFDQFAYSHGRAAGLWQFVPDTGRRFGLEQNWWYDGRRDVTASTKAALDLLEYLNKKFDGNWLHALAAYNTGEGRVFRAIRANEKAGKPTDFWSLDLPKETSGYVPKLLALGDVVRNRVKYGLDVPAIANKPVVTNVDPGIQMDLALAANYADLPLRELQSLNPGYNHWATAPDGPTHLLLPINKVDRFKTQLAKNDNRGIKVIRYKVKSGDTLSEIASNNNTTIKVLQRANNLKGTSIRVGKHLIVPVALKDANQYSLSEPQRLAKTQSTRRGNYKMTHKVASGESLWSISRKYDVSYKSLAKWNGMAPSDPLRPGQSLVVWKKAPTGGTIRKITYKIRQGDSLSVIADKFDVSVSDLLKWNQLNRKAYIKPGQTLRLFIDVTKVSS